MFKTSARALAVALSRAAPIVERRNTIPILGTARLRREAGVLTIEATNLDIELETDVTVEPIGASEEACVYPWPMLAILRMLPRTDAVELIVEGESAVLSWNGGRMRSGTLPAADWPKMNPANTVVKVALEAPARDALNRVVPFISNEETRYYLNGVCLDRQGAGKEGCFVATDGTRMAVMPGGGSLTALLAEVGDLRPIVPRDAVRHWVNLWARADVEVGLEGDGPGRLAVSADGTRFRAKLIDGSFPQWSRIIPDTADLEPLTLPRPTLLRACALARVTAERGHSNGTLIVASGRVQLKTRSLERGEMAVDVGPSGEAADRTLDVNLRYLTAAVNATRGLSVTLWTHKGTDADRGAVPLRGADAQVGEHVIVMPLRSGSNPTLDAPPYQEPVAA